MTDTAAAALSRRALLLEEPFRLFFPVGVVAALAGVAPWVLSFAGVQFGMAGYGHGMVQILGFEMAFAVGFLMTAMPRFLEVPGARMGELVLGLALCVGTVSALSLQYTAIGQGLFLAQSIHLLVFILRRLRERGDDPPPYFAFLPIGLLSAILGTGLILWPI